MPHFVKFPNYVDTPCLLSRRALEFKDGILYLPLYMAPLLWRGNLG